jgi:CubicO group peptidase (beta-lactamase class C family)
MDIDALALDAAFAEDDFSGVVTVDVGDRRVLEKVAGFAHRGHGIPNTLDTRFGIASGGKGFTALAIMRLVEEGRLALDDRVREILDDDLPLIDEGVTIEQLLTHSSGIGDYLDESGDGDISDHVLAVPVHRLENAESFLPVIDGFEQAFPPGERFAYNNGGYIVLAIVIERVSGEAYADFVQREVVERAGLAKTGFLRSDDLPGDAALGYLDAEGNRTNVLHLPVRGNGDGGIYSTAGDLHTFWRAFVAGSIVGAETVAEMTRPRFDIEDEDARYGLGLYLHATGSALYLEGYDAGVSFRSTHDPATATTVTVIGNTSEGAWPVVGEFTPLFD